MPIRGRGGKQKRGSSSTRLWGTAPGTPTINSVANVGTNRAYDNGAVIVTFTADSNSTSATTFRVTSSGGHVATGSSSPITVTGLSSNTSYTFQVRGENQYGNSSYSSSSSSVTATTVPATPSAPSVSSPTPSSGVNVAGTTTDSVSWTAPANGGVSISNYEWTSSDSKSGQTASTSVSVNQEGGTSQTYQVRAYNSNGWSSFSSASSSVTTFAFTPFSVFSFSPFSVFGFSPFSVFGFSPFSVFGFSPFGFSPFSVFGFSPFSVFGFSPFGFSPFGFSPFGFSPFGFSPFGVFGFSPFSPRFAPRPYSLAPYTKVVMADGTLKEVQDLNIGDQLMSAELPGLSTDYSTIDLISWNTTSDFSSLTPTTTTVNRIVSHAASLLIRINGDAFSESHLLLTKRNNEVRMILAKDILETDQIWSNNQWNEITELQSIEYENNVININCEPYDIFFTENALTHDGREYYSE